MEISILKLSLNAAKVTRSSKLSSFLGQASNPTVQTLCDVFREELQVSPGIFFISGENIRNSEYPGNTDEDIVQRCKDASIQDNIPTLRSLARSEGLSKLRQEVSIKFACDILTGTPFETSWVHIYSLALALDDSNVASEGQLVSLAQKAIHYANFVKS